MLKPIHAVEVRGKGSALWFTVAFETTAAGARRELRRVRDWLKAHKLRAAYRVQEYRFRRGQWEAKNVKA
jgi:hypothetical protein